MLAGAAHGADGGAAHRAVRLLGVGSPGRHCRGPADYLVFNAAADGSVRLVFRTRVVLREPLRSASARALQHTDSRDRDRVVARLRNAQGAVVFQDVIAIPRWLRGEFHGAPGTDGGFTIDGHLISTTGTAFVVRVPALDGATLDLDSDLITDATEFRLDALPATRVVGPAPPPLPGWSNGPSANRVDLLILGDGYTTAQQSTFDADALSLANDFFALSPYDEYRNFVNVAALFTPSTDSGADQPAYNPSCAEYARVQTCCADGSASGETPTTVATAFDGTFCSYNIQRLATVDYSKVLIAAAGEPDWDQILVLINSPTYGGAGGGISVVTNNPFAVDVAQHEYGHTFTLLADEYDSAYPGYPPCSDVGGPACQANVTDETTRALVKWERWIDASQPVPSSGPPPVQTDAGLWEGARYLATGMYRQGYNCAMRALAAPFCDVASEAYTLRLYAGGWGVPASGIDNIEPGSEIPAPGAVGAPYPGGTYTATVLGPQAGPDVVAEWYVDAGLVDTQSLATGALATHDLVTSPGPHTLELRITDMSPIIHSSMRAGIASSRTWNVTVGPNLFCGNAALDAGENCDDGDPDAGDGCSAACQIEPCWTCVGLPSVCTPDDGAPCDDDDACTVGETCSATVCGGGTPITTCTDGDACCPAGCDVGTDSDCAPPTPTPTATATPGCGAAPLAGCRTPAAPQAGSLQLKNTGSPHTKDQLQWKWSKGSVTSKADLGVPTSATHYQICIYDGTPSLIADATIPAGGLCGTTSLKPCWKETSKGFDYKDKGLTPDGVEQLKLKEGLLAGKTQIQLKGKGTLLDDPTFPIAQPLRVQLRNTANDICWEATYSAPASRNVVGPPGQFKDKAD